MADLRQVHSEPRLILHFCLRVCAARLVRDRCEVAPILATLSTLGIGLIGTAAVGDGYGAAQLTTYGYCLLPTTFTAIARVAADAALLSITAAETAAPKPLVSVSMQLLLPQRCKLHSHALRPCKATMQLRWRRRSAHIRPHVQQGRGTTSSSQWWATSLTAFGLCKVPAVDLQAARQRLLCLPQSRVQAKCAILHSMWCRKTSITG